MNNKLLKTSSGNSYIFDQENNQSLYLHPILKFIASVDSADNFDEVIDRLYFPFEWEGYLISSKKDLLYYKSKYKFLKTNYKRTTLMYDFETEVNLSQENIKYFISNTKHILFETTERCNLNCIYCTYGELYESKQNKNRYGIDLNFEDAKTFIDYILEHIYSAYNQSYKNEIRIGFYGGEPLMNFSLIEKVVEYCKHIETEYISFSFGMTTNGILLHKYMDFLVKNEFHLLISLDGDEKNNKFRIFPDGRNSYRYVKNNIDKMKDKYEEYFIKYVAFNAVVNSSNSYFQVYNYFTKNYMKWPSCSMVNSLGVENCKKEEYSFIHNIAPYEGFEDPQNKQFYKQHIFSFPEGMISRKFIERCNDGHIVRSYRDLLMKKKIIKIPPTGTCLPFSKKIYLTAKGFILPCEKIDHSHYLGVCRDKKVCLNLSQIAQKYNKYYSDMNEKCANCHIGRLCDLCLLQLSSADQQFSCPYKTTQKAAEKAYNDSFEALETNKNLYRRIIEEY